jgi:DNA-binding PadR family transcriptional regulator
MFDFRVGMGLRQGQRARGDESSAAEPDVRLTTQSESDITGGNMKAEAFLPLSKAPLYILLALAAEDRHGYGIMQEVVRQSSGQYKLGPGTLYDNLQKLVNQGLITETSARFVKDDPRRRYYRLTGLGRRVLAAEVERMEAVVQEARRHLPAISPGRAI